MLLDGLERLLEATRTGFWEWDSRTDEVRWSPTMGPLHGLEPGAQPSGYGDYLRRVVRPDQQADLETQVRGALERGEGFTRESWVTLPDGSARCLHSRAHVVTDEDGTPVGLAGVMTDVTESRERDAALRFLAAASEPLFGSLDPWETLQQIADLAVPRLADWCAIQLAPELRGGFENAAVAHVDPDKVRWARELEERYPPDPAAPTGAPQVIRTGRSEIYPVIPEELLRASARDEEHWEIIRALGIQSAMIVPLRARERTLGAITFIHAESGRTYTTEDLRLAEVLGRRAGLALDHARLYARERSTAETLQRALLPSALPEVAGYELAVRYRPGREGDRAGGDWYDAFPLDAGRLGLAVGDVGGRGITAAASMGQIRNALRAYAAIDGDPASVLARLHRLVDGFAEPLFATVVYGVLDPATGALELASAGHLPALVVDGPGAATVADAPSAPALGVGAPEACPVHRVEVRPGSTVLLYTDGLVERRGEHLDAGLERLRAAAAVGGDAEAVADAAITGAGEPGEDDVALLALRRRAA